MHWTHFQSIYWADVSAETAEYASLIGYSWPLLGVDFVHFYGARRTDAGAHSAADAAVIVEFEHTPVVRSIILADLGVHDGCPGLEEVTDSSPNSL